MYGYCHLKLWLGASLLLLFITACVWSKARDPFDRIYFSIRTSTGAKCKGIAVLPKQRLQSPVVVYLHGAGETLINTGEALRQLAELDLIAVGVEYDQNSQSHFDEEFVLINKYLQQQSWNNGKATAWIGFSLG